MTEDDIRKKLISKLKELDSRGQISDIIDNCGTCEYGADLCFKKNDIFGQPRTYGIQLKKDDINAYDVEKILGQLSIAFGHEFPFCSGKQYLNYMYIVTGGSISPTARDYFKEANVGFRNIFLIDEDILNLFINLNMDLDKLVGEN